MNFLKETVANFVYIVRVLIVVLFLPLVATGVLFLFAREQWLWGSVSVVFLLFCISAFMTYLGI